MRNGIIGLILVGTVALTMGGCISVGIKENARDKFIETYEGSKVRKIVFVGDTVDLNIKEGEGEDIIVNGEMEGGYKGEIDNNILKIESKENKNVVFGLRGTTTKLTIQIPKDIKLDLDLKFGAGNINVSKTALGKINLDGGAGDIKIGDISFDYFDYKGGAGDLDIDVKKLGLMKIKAGVGDIDITCTEEIKGHANIKGGVGNITLKIPNNSPVKFDVDSGIGTNDIKDKTNGKDTYLYEIKSGIGDIEIK